MIGPLLCGLAFSLAAQGAEPRIFYSKSFPGSTPAYVEITIDKAGATVYKEAPDDDQPLRFKLPADAANEIFQLAEKLAFFTRKLESDLNVAKMGLKTFRFEDGVTKSEAQFNYSLDPDARILHDWFERITETQMHRISLERTARFDRLGVNKVLLQIESSWDRNRLVGVEQFLPLLDRVARNDVYLHMARERAAGLAEAFRNPKPAPPKPEQSTTAP